jgi:hypothetical protein
MGTRNKSMSELLREALAAAPSLNSVAVATGLIASAVWRFSKGKTSLRLDLADKLAAHFGIVSRATRPTRPARKGGRGKGKAAADAH